MILSEVKFSSLNSLSFFAMTLLMLLARGLKSDNRGRCEQLFINAWEMVVWIIKLIHSCFNVIPMNLSYSIVNVVLVTFLKPIEAITVKHIFEKKQF